MRPYWVAALAAGALLGLPKAAPAASTTVAWDQVTAPHLAGYKVHYGPASRSYTAHLDVGNAALHTVGGLEDCRPFYLSVTAYNSLGDESTYSDEVSFATPCPQQEVVSTPAAPAGPAAGEAGESYTYSAGGAVSNLGDPVEYRFSWSDGSLSAWLPQGVTSAAKSWAEPGAYTGVTVEARCALHPSVVSAPSPPIVVTIRGVTAETVTAAAPPSGPTSGVVGVAYQYSAAGAASSAGDPVQYRFSWADGTVSEWLPAASAVAAKSWAAPGIYAQVLVEARCALHQEVLAAPSAPITVTIADADAETLSPPTVLSGSAEAQAGTSHAFTAGGALSDRGDPLRYRFDWGDGTASAWEQTQAQALAWKTWQVPGSYFVRAEAGCVLHPPVTALSESFGVAVAQNPALLFADDFDDAGGGGDPDWRAIAGRWAGQSAALAATGTGADNLIVVRSQATFPAGRIDTRLRLLPSRKTIPNGGVVFSYRGAASYRYLLAFEGRLVLGQVGDTPLVRGGALHAARTELPARRWHALSVQLYADGTVRAFVDGGTEPALKYRFPDAVPGRVGYLARRSRAAFDEMRVWDASVLPERR